MSQTLRTAEEVACRLGVPRSWVYRAARGGVLPSVRCGRYRRFDDRDIDCWIESQRRAGLPAATSREGSR
jgi:excisionase family DNA binding protein